ncbi:hypothetical protein [Heyndrickxia coagulans]|uniref:hypothetical protein n=1 Tax=Heyndrickxia coagulans TaxID=1398 RepID=UPI00268BF08E
MTKWDQKIDWLINRLKQDQSSDGSWAYPFDTGTTTDAYMIILLRTLAVQEDQLIRGLAQRILSKQMVASKRSNLIFSARTKNFKQTVR